MTARRGPRGKADDLRRLAEEKAREKGARIPEDLEKLSPGEARKLLHELRVHQIELEMQNEELRRVQLELEASHAGYFDLYDLAPVGYCTLSEKGLILKANLTAARLLGVAVSRLVNQPFSSLITPEDRDIFYLRRRKLFPTSQPQSFEMRMVRQDGAFLWTGVQATAARDPESGAPVCRITLSDISELKRVEDELRQAKELLEQANRKLQQSFALEQQLARKDDLTGLFNRRHFLELADREFGASVRYRRPLSILMIDTDRLKLVNDSFGHKAGDKMLVTVARTAAAQLRAADVMARYGGDEFIILLPQTGAQEAFPIAERIRESVAAARLENERGSFTVTLSIGIADMIREPRDASVQDVVQRADKVLYAAKTAGGNRTAMAPAAGEARAVPTARRARRQGDRAGAAAAEGKGARP